MGGSMRPPSASWVERCQRVHDADGTAQGVGGTPGHRGPEDLPSGRVRSCPRRPCTAPRRPAPRCWGTGTGSGSPVRAVGGIRGTRRTPMRRMFTTREGSPSLRRRAAMWTARVLGAETVRLPDGVQDALREQSGCSRLFGETHQQVELRGRQSDRRLVQVRLAGASIDGRRADSRRYMRSVPSADRDGPRRGGLVGVRGTYGHSHLPPAGRRKLEDPGLPVAAVLEMGVERVDAALGAVEGDPQLGHRGEVELRLDATEVQVRRSAAGREGGRSFRARSGRTRVPEPHSGRTIPAKATGADTARVHDPNGAAGAGSGIFAAVSELTD